MLRSLAKTHGLTVIYVNQVGGNDSLLFDGGSMVILHRMGELVAQALSFEEDLILFDTETKSGDMRRQPIERARQLP